MEKLELDAEMLIKKNSNSNGLVSWVFVFESTIFFERNRSELEKGNVIVDEFGVPYVLTGKMIFEKIQQRGVDYG